MSHLANELDQQLDAMGRGSRSQLADACGVRAASVTGWIRQGNTPTRDKWPLIEEFCSWPEGRIAELVGEVSVARLERLQAQIDSLTQRLEQLERPEN